MFGACIDEKQRTKGGGAGGEWGADPPLAVIPDIKEQVARTVAVAAANRKSSPFLYHLCLLSLSC